jgi:putative transposon-encoded protein
MKYDSDTGILAGDVEFSFERSTSWKFLTHRYNRHPKFDFKLSYSMDVANPGTAAEAAFSGTVTLSGGSGSITCNIEAGSGSNWADDQCSLYVKITVGGGHTYKSSW